MSNNIVSHSNNINDNHIRRRNRSGVSKRKSIDLRTLYKKWEIHDNGLVFVDVNEYSIRDYIAFPFDT